MSTIVQHKGRFISAGVFGALLIISVLLVQAPSGGWFAETTRDAGFVLSDLKITGLNRTGEADVQAILDIDNGMPLLSIDLGELQKRIEALPWVKLADVSRVLPGGINIQITERVPYALLQRAGEVVLIDPSGAEITAYGLAEFSNLILLVGDVGSQDLDYLEHIKEMAPELAHRIHSAVRISGQRWDFIFENGIRIKLPADDAQPYSGQQAWERFVRLDAKHQLLSREVNVIDLRAPDRLVMRVTPEGRRLMRGKDWVL